MNLEEVIKQPVLTEKAMENQENGCYLFWVLPKANKEQIKRAVEKLFGVKPKSVRTAGVGKKKKAFIQLSVGEEISVAKLSE